MTVQPNGTDAKDIALHFIEVTSGRATRAIMGKTMMQAKSLLSSGYSKDEIIKSIDFIISKGTNMYSLGYVSACINDVLREVRKLEVKEIAREAVASATLEGVEVVPDVESTERNRDKYRRLGIQSRFGEKYHLDMFEEPGQDN